HSPKIALSKRVQQAPPHAPGKRPKGVRPLGGQTVAGTNEPRHLGLREPFGVTTRTKIPPVRPALGHSMVDSRSRLVEQHTVGPTLAHPNAKLGLFAPDRQRTDPANTVLKTPDNFKDFAPER